MSVDTGDTITINDAGGAAGQIHLVDSQDLIMVTNDRLFLIRDGADWYELTRAVDNERIVQIVSTETGAVSTGSTVIPFDDTIPTITEGNEYMTRTITPVSASNRLLIEVTAHVEHGVSAIRHLAVALFRDAEANALACAFTRTESDGRPVVITFQHIMTAPGTSEVTFRVRIGVETSGTVTFNGVGGSRKYGGVLASSIVVTEIGP